MGERELFAANPERVANPSPGETAVRVGLVSLTPRDHPDDSLAAALPLLRQAAREGAQLAVLPETWAGSTPYPRGWEALAAFARETGVTVAGSLREHEGGRLWNRLRVFGPAGEQACYTKLYPYPPDEPDVTPGQSPVIARLLGWDSGLAICFDLNVPELFRAYARHGAQLFLVCAAWPADYAWLAEVYARARAAENQAYLVLANRPGAPSLIVAPDGRVVARRDTEGLVVGDLDRRLLEAYREAFPLLSWESVRQPGPPLTGTGPSGYP